MSVWNTSEDCEKTIECAELKNGEVAFGDLVITKEPESEPEMVMTISEIEAKLGIKNLRIKSENEADE